MASQQYPAGHKPTMTEKVQEKVTDLKDKLTGHHSHPASGTTASTTTPATTKHTGSMLDKVKEKLPGYRGTTGHDPSEYESEQGTTGYGTSGYEPTMGQQVKDTVTPGHHHDTADRHGDPSGHGAGHGASTGYGHGHDTTTSGGCTFTGTTGGF